METWISYPCNFLCDNFDRFSLVFNKGYHTAHERKSTISQGKNLMRIMDEYGTLMVMIDQMQVFSNSCSGLLVSSSHLNDDTTRLLRAYLRRVRFRRVTVVDGHILRSSDGRFFAALHCFTAESVLIGNGFLGESLHRVRFHVRGTVRIAGRFHAHRLGIIDGRRNFHGRNDGSVVRIKGSTTDDGQVVQRTTWTSRQVFV